MNYVSPNGLDQIIESFTRDDTFRSFSRELTHLSFDPSSMKWNATCSSGLIETFDGIILTIPTTNLLQLRGNYSELLPDRFLDKLKSTRYSSR
jgi:protoporphyrinogen oxidase